MMTISPHPALAYAVFSVRVGVTCTRGWPTDGPSDRLTKRSRTSRWFSFLGGWLKRSFVLRNFSSVDVTHMSEFYHPLAWGMDPLIW